MLQVVINVYFLGIINRYIFCVLCKYKLDDGDDYGG